MPRSQTKQEWVKQAFDDIHEEIKDKEALSYLDFLRIRNFKLNNSTLEEEQTIQEKTRKAFKEANNNQLTQAIQTLCELDGVRAPTASAILAIKKPKKYAILDRKVISALHKQEAIDEKTRDIWLKRYDKDAKIYESYMKALRENKPKDKTLREYEYSLYLEG